MVRAEVLVDADVAPYVLRVTAGPDAGQQVPFAGRIVVGRGEVDVHLSDPAVSRRHLLLQADANGVRVVDAGSAAGVRLGGRRVRGEAVVPPGGILQLADTTAVLLTPRLHSVETRTAPRLLHQRKGQDLGALVVDRELLVGRDGGCDIAVADPSVSRRHAAVRPDGDGLVVIDLGSRNGTKVNGRAITGQRPLRPGDELCFGRAPDLVLVADHRPQAATATQLRVQVEQDPRVWAIHLDAPPGTTVAQVADALAAYLGEPMARDPSWGVYRAQDGMLPMSTDTWDAFAPTRGDLLVLARIPELSVPVPVRSPAAGRDTVNVPPRTVWPSGAVSVTVPRPPESTSLRGRGVVWQVAGGSVAIVAAIVLALTFPGFAVFALVGALAGLGALAFGLVGEQSRRRHQLRQYREKVDAMAAILASATEQQRSQLDRLNPGDDELARWVGNRSERLWERRSGDPDALRLRLGVGTQPALVDLQRSGEAETGSYGQEAAAVLEQYRELVGVPVTTPTGGVLGIAGPRSAVLDLAARLLLEAAVLHAPSALSVAVVAPGDDWTWSRWLPHLATPGGPALTLGDADGERLLDELVLGLTRAGAVDRHGQGAGPRRLVVLGHDAMALPGAADLLRAWTPPVGLVLVLADDARELPPECTAVVRITGHTASAVGRWEGGPSADFAPVALDAVRAARLALALGELRDPRTDSGAAATGGVLELSGATNGGGLDLRRSWSRTDTRPLEAKFGVDDNGQPVAVDFRRDGPHGVVAGTTGSGKSELLLSLLASLAATHSPEQLALFLIDYKGGATFGPLEQLPHVVGLVTDLDGDDRLVRRAFIALEAEIGRRKRLLGTAGVPDLVSYEQLPVAVEHPVPPLLVVIDEFALLVSSRPDAKARLDSVATQGRSLGVHLLLATQSPSGVVTQAIRANTNLWLCLRVVSESESQEIIGRKDAARIPVSAPGRALMRRGAEDSVVAFQTARVTRPVNSGSTAARVVVAPFADRSPAARLVPAGELDGRTELDLLVAAADDAAGVLGSRAMTPLWLPPLPELVPAAALPDLLGEGALVVRLGLGDQPERQRQSVWTVDLALSNLAVSGVFRSGRTTVLRQVACELATRYTPSQVHIYAIDSRGALADLADLPHVGAVVRVDERERLVRVFDRLGSLVEQRRSGAAGAAPRVVLLLDDYPAFREVAEDLLQGALQDQLYSLVTNGRGVGVHVVLATSQLTDLRLTFAAQFQSRVLLRQADPADYAALELRISGDELPPPLPGRALVTGGTEVQIAVPDVAGVAAAALKTDGAPVPVRPLPREVDTDAPGLVAARGQGVVLGIGGPELAPIAISGHRHGPHLLVLGEGGSGRTTALETYAMGALDADPDLRLVLVVMRAGSLRRLQEHPRVEAVASTGEQVGGALDAAQVDPGHRLLVIDDAEGFPAGQGDRLEQLLRSARDAGLRTAVAARTADWVRMFDGWSRYLTSLRVAVLLAPNAEAGHLLDVRLPATVVPMVPGRGYLVDRGTAVLLQVARSSTSSTSSTS